MYPVSADFLSSVRKSHISHVKIEIYDMANNKIISTAQPVSGEVTIDSRRDIRRQCTIEFIDRDGTLVPKNNTSAILLPYNREIKIFRGVQFADGTEELVPLGVFILTTVEITDTPEGVRIVVQGSDRSLRVIRAKWTNHDFYIEDGTKKEDAIKNILVDKFPDVQTIFPATNQVTDLMYPTLDQSSNPWKEALKIAESVGMDLYFDENGIARMRTIPDPDTGLPLVTYTDTSESVLTSLSRSLSSDDSFNHVIYTGEGTNLSIGVIGEAKDENPVSPTYVETYGSVPIFKSSPYILTVAEAQEAATAELRKVIGALELISWQQIVNPAHDVYDLVKVTRTPSGVNATLMLDSITIPLSPQSTMNAIGRSRRF
jgi:hypothetical protein